MARVGLDRARVLAAAAELADREGLEGLTLGRLAAALTVRPPSLYNHVEGLSDLLDALTARAYEELLADARAAMAAGAGFAALAALAEGQRAYAKAHPGLYAASLRPVLQQGAEAQRAGQAYLDLVLAILRDGYGLSGDAALHGVRCLRAALRGFLDLESGGGFGLPLSVDESFRRLLAMVDRGLTGGAADQS